ncbi:MAG TPA: DnaJ domain-containing protein [Cyclobacteriaceae bacterium]|jgi:hypothetical protein|nr:DnaJ domain-containing protein [Cyclobacteriaceae bacterium]
MNRIDHYSILGIGREATDSDVKEAYRKLAKALHPDKNSDDKTFYTRYFQLLNEAKEVLLDSKKKAQFNANQFNRSEESNQAWEVNSLKNEISILKKKIYILERELERTKAALKTKDREVEDFNRSINGAHFEVEEFKYKLIKARKVKTGLVILSCFLFIMLLVFVNKIIKSNDHYREEIPFLVDSVQLANSLDSNVYSKSFKRKSIRFLNPRLQIKALLPQKIVLKLDVKFINPDGTVSRYPPDSKNEFSYQEIINYQPDLNIIRLHGWGNNSKSFFHCGQNAVEIWYKSRIIAKGNFSIDE